MLCPECFISLINFFICFKKKNKNRAVQDLDEIVIVKNDNTIEKINPFLEQYVQTNLQNSTSSEDVIFDRHNFTQNKIIKRKIKKKKKRKPLAIKETNIDNYIEKNTLPKKKIQNKILKKNEEIKKNDKEILNEKNEEILTEKNEEILTEKNEEILTEKNNNYLKVESISNEEQELKESVEELKNKILEEDWDLLED